MLGANCILVGQVEAYCLACEQPLRGEASAAAHVREPAHAASLRALGYFDKYKDDGIRKVKSGYFCGACNVLVRTAARVGLHVREPAHGGRRGALLLRRARGAGAGGVLARGRVLLHDDAWHGLVADACVVCNAEFDSKDTHKNEHEHILNLVQSKAIFGPGDSVYREIDGNSYHCLTCNNVFAAASFDEHFDSADHKTTLKQCEITDEDLLSNDELNGTDGIDGFTENKRNGYNKTSIGDKQNAVVEESHETSEVNRVDEDDSYCKHREEFKLQPENGKETALIKIENDFKNNLETKTDIESAAEIKTIEHVKGKTLEVGSNTYHIVNSVSKFERNEVNINLKTDTAFCKKCSTNIDFDFDAINKHIDDHKKTNKNNDEVPFEHDAQANGGNKNLSTKPVFSKQSGEQASTTSLEDIMAVAKKNGMMYNGRELRCTTCDSVLPPSIKNIEEHVSGSKHKAKLPRPVEKQEPKTKISKQLIELFVKDTKIFDEDGCKEFVINEKYCVPFLSLQFLSQSFNVMACLACNTTLSSPTLVNDHVNSSKHVKILEQCCVITSLESEFVREMRPGVYHCGYCNAAVGDWKGLEKHLKTAAHKRCKARADRRLHKHLSDVRANKTKPGVYNCSFCKYVAEDWDTLNQHFSTRAHVVTKAREEQRVRVLMDCIKDPKMRQEINSGMLGALKAQTSYAYNSSSDSD